MKRYALKGVNDDQHECSVCGRVELKRVMWLVSLDADGNQEGEAFHCGTTCGAKLLGYTQSKIKTKVSHFEYEVWEQRQQLIRQYENERNINKKYTELNRLELYGNERLNHPIYQQIKAISAAAKAWADSQEILISL